MGNAKVADLDLGAVRGPEEVGRFDVAVDDALVVDYMVLMKIKLTTDRGERTIFEP